MTNEIISQAEQKIIHTYNRHQVVLERGEGMYLYDVDKKKYLDFGSGIGVFALGYHDEEFNNYLKEQIDSLVHTSNYFYNKPAVDAATLLTEASGMKKFFFTNSGAEAVEGALKLARKYAYNKHGHDKTQIIAMKHSFHGRTIGALSVTGNDHYQEAFKPLVGDVVFAEFNNLDSVKALAGSNTCAIIMETVQGEGGVVPATEEFIKGVREICTENDIVMICDEIQCGTGRSGKMFAYQTYGVTPDVVTCAKAIGGGVPVGAFGATEGFCDALVAGDHGTTYGGNPLATQAVKATFEIFKKRNILAHVNEVIPYLEEKLDGLVEKYDCVLLRRGKGLMQGIQLNKAPGEVVGKALEAGLIIFNAGDNVVRFLPPLIVEKSHIDEMIQIMESVFDSQQ